MKFFDDHQIVFYEARKRHLAGADHLDVPTWLKQSTPTLLSNGFFKRAYHECQWLNNRRPYYSVYPAIADALMRVTLDLDCALVKMPLPQLLFRFAENCPPELGEYRLRTFLAAELSESGKRSLGLWVRHQFQGNVLLSSCIYPMTPGKTVEDVIANDPFEDPICESLRGDLRKMLEPSLRIIVAVCLMQNDPDLITPDVLADDADRFQQTGDEKFVDRAHRRGKVGWLVGSHLEVNPHYRRAHFGLRWTGRGGAIPRVVPVQGCIVKRNKVNEVPSGYLDDDQRGKADRDIGTAQPPNTGSQKI